MGCSVTECWGWLVVLAPTLFLVWTFWDASRRPKYGLTEYDRERMRTLEHFYRTIMGESPEYDRIGQLKFAFDRDVHFIPADMNKPRPEELRDLVKRRDNLIGELSFLDTRRKASPADIDFLE